MSVEQNMNQFSQTPIKGMIAAITNPTTLSAIIDPASVATLYAGDGVRVTDSVNPGLPVDIAIATLPVFGFILYNPKKDSFAAGDAVELALPESILYLESAAAIARGKLLEFVPASHSVKEWAGANPVSGYSLDKASAAAQLIRVKVRETDDEDVSSSSSCRSSSSSCRSSSSSSSSSTS